MDTNEWEFYFVWRAGGPPPTRHHPAEHSAKTEAERLARENPGTKFYVGRCASFCEVAPPPPIWTELQQVPF